MCLFVGERSSELVDRGAALVGIPRGDGDTGARFGQAARDAQADAPVTTCDDGYLAVQIEQVHPQTW